MLTLVDDLLGWLFPSRCVLCGACASGFDLCMPCLDDLPWLDHACHRCARPLAAGQPCACAPGGPVDATVAALLYEYPVDRLLAALKYRGRVEYARVLGELLAIRLAEEAQRASMPGPACIIPVPLHKTRLRERGYNQAELIAQRVALATGVPVLSHAAVRKLATPAQISLHRNARLRNLRNAFGISASGIGGHVAVLDDVVTTGATTVSLAQALKRAGATRVTVWTVARTADFSRVRAGRYS